MMTSAAETPSSLWMSAGMPRPLSRTVTEPSPLQDHLDAVAIAGQRLVDGVVDDLVDHVVQAGAVVGVADIHAGALAHGIEAAQHLDRIGVVVLAVVGGGSRSDSWVRWLAHRCFDSEGAVQCRPAIDAVGHARRTARGRRAAEQVGVGAGHPGLHAQRQDLLEQGRRAARHRDGPRSRRAAAAAAGRATASPAAHAPARSRPAAPSARRSSPRPPAGRGRDGGRARSLRCGPRCGAGLGVAQAAGGQLAAQPVLGVERRHRGQPAIDLAAMASEARGNGPTPSRAAASRRCTVSAPGRQAPRRGGPWCLPARRASADRGCPRRSSGRARAAHSRRRATSPACSGCERRDQAVEEAPALAGAVEEQAVHLRRQPDRRDMQAERGLAGGRPAVDAHQPARQAALAAGRLQAGADREPSVRRVAAWRRPPRRRRPARRCADRGGRPRPGGPGAGRGPAPGRRAPPAGWSCPRRWGRPAPPASRSQSSRSWR